MKEKAKICYVERSTTLGSAAQVLFAPLFLLSPFALVLEDLEAAE